VARKVEDALNILTFSKRGMAVDAKKVFASAIANAENNHNLDVDSLVVAEASVGKSMTMKRFHTRGRGKSTRILKPFSRLRIVVREQEKRLKSWVRRAIRTPRCDHRQEGCRH
jgi:large subunit ribosomal protein L22